MELEISWAFPSIPPAVRKLVLEQSEGAINPPFGWHCRFYFARNEGGKGG